MMKRKLKILQGIRQGKIGGGENYLLGLVDGLDRQCFESIVLSFSDGPMIDRLQEAGIKTYVLPTQQPFDLAVWQRVYAIIKKEDIDIVHAHGTRAASNLFYGAKMAKKPMVYTCHGWSFHPDQNKLVYKLRVLSEKWLTKQAAITICGCEANRQTAKKLFGKFEAQLIYNAIDHQKFLADGCYHDLRKQLNIAPNEVLITSIARFTLQKQPLALIQAFASLATQIPEAKLLMVGDGELKEDCVALVASLGLQQRVILLSARQDVPDLLAATDVFVLPSLWEGFPLALIEAMCMGKAVVATNVDGNVELVQHGVNGLLADVSNLEASLKQCLLRLCNNYVLRRKLGVKGIEAVSDKYALPTMVKQNSEVYQRLMIDETIASLKMTAL